MIFHLALPHKLYWQIRSMVILYNLKTNKAEFVYYFGEAWQKTIEYKCFPMSCLSGRVSSRLTTGMKETLFVDDRIHYFKGGTFFYGVALCCCCLWDVLNCLLCACSLD